MKQAKSPTKTRKIYTITNKAPSNLLSVFFSKSFIVHRVIHTEHHALCDKSSFQCKSLQSVVSIYRYKRGVLDFSFQGKSSNITTANSSVTKLLTPSVNTWPVTVEITVSCYVNSVSSQLSQLIEQYNDPVIQYCEFTQKQITSFG